MKDFLGNILATTISFGLLIVFCKVADMNLLPATSTAPAPAVATFQTAIAAELAAVPEADTIRAMCDQMAVALEFDGQQAAPLVTTTADVGVKFQSLQRFRFAGQSPFGDRYAHLETLFAGEMKKRLALGDLAQPLTPELRSAAVGLFREVSLAK